jgi:hypothetical protein
MAASSSSLVAFEGVAMFCVLLCDDVMAAAVGRKLQKGKQVYALPSALGGKHTYMYVQPEISINSPRSIRH